MKTTYRWREGTRHWGIDPAAAAKEFERIRLKYGDLTSDVMVDESRDPAAVLHRAFEWDSEAAAETYRRQQAGSLIRSLLVIRDEQPPERLFYFTPNLEDRRSGAWLPGTVIANQPDKRTLALIELHKSVSEAIESLHEFERICAATGTEPDRMALIAVAVQTAEALKIAVGAIQ